MTSTCRGMGAGEPGRAARRIPRASRVSAEANGIFWGSWTWPGEADTAAAGDGFAAGRRSLHRLGGRSARRRIRDHNFSPMRNFLPAALDRMHAERCFHPLRSWHSSHWKRSHTAAPWRESRSTSERRMLPRLRYGGIMVPRCDEPCPPLRIDDRPARRAFDHRIPTWTAEHRARPQTPAYAARER